MADFEETLEQVAEKAAGDAAGTAAVIAANVAAEETAEAIKGEIASEVRKELEHELVEAMQWQETKNDLEALRVQTTQLQTQLEAVYQALQAGHQTILEQIATYSKPEPIPEMNPKSEGEENPVQAAVEALPEIPRRRWI